MALATEERQLSESALLEELCAGRTLVVGLEARADAERLLESPLLASLGLRVSAKVGPLAWELF